MKEPIIPKKLYKYRTMEEKAYLEDFFINHKIYFNSPNQFNDPFDCRIHRDVSYPKKKQRDYWKEKFKRGLKRGLDSKIQPFFEKEIKTYFYHYMKIRKIRIPKNLSFESILNHTHFRNFSPSIRNDWIREKVSWKLTNTEEWHERVNQASWQNMDTWLRIYCLSEDNKNILMYSHYAGKHTGFCLEFSNLHEYPFNLILPVHYDSKMSRFQYDMTAEETIRYVTFKAEDWKYEKEYRAFQNYKEHKFDFNPECITSIIFGCKMVEDDKKLLKSWAKKGKLSVQYKEASMIKNTFALKIEDIKQD